MLDPPVPIPGPKQRFIVGNTLEFQKQPLDFVMKYAAKYPDIFQFKIGFDRWVLINRPEYIYDVLVKRAQLFHKPKLVKRLWKLFLGNGVLSSDGDDWKRKHKLVKPGFHKKRIDEYATIMVSNTERLIREQWQPGAEREIVDDMTALTLTIVAKTLFDADVQDDAGTVGNAMMVLNEEMVNHINKPIPVPRWWPSKANKRKLKAIADIEEIVWRIVKERRGSNKDHGDLLSMLVFSEDENGDRLDDKELRDEAMTLFFAGHETTAIALVWMLYLMAKHPEVKKKLDAELQSVCKDRSPGLDDLHQLPYLDMVVKECMRILPSVWCFMRSPTEDIRLGPHEIKAGDIVFISTYVTQHDGRYFEDPEEFRPERFSVENEKKLPKGAYVPFAAGPRICLGKTFAMMEARLILGTICQHADVELDPDHTLELLPQLSLHPVGGLSLKVHPKASSTLWKRED